MGTTVRVAILWMAMFMPTFATADSAIRSSSFILVAPIADRSTQQRCWIEHVQAQPVSAATRRFLVSAAEAGARGRAIDEHLGSEHWTTAAQRSCRLQST